MISMQWQMKMRVRDERSGFNNRFIMNSQNVSPGNYLMVPIHSDVRYETLVITTQMWYGKQTWAQMKCKWKVNSWCPFIIHNIKWTMWEWLKSVQPLNCQNLYQFPVLLKCDTEMDETNIQFVLCNTLVCTSYWTLPNHQLNLWTLCVWLALGSDSLYFVKVKIGLVSDQIWWLNFYKRQLNRLSECTSTH